MRNVARSPAVATCALLTTSVCVCVGGLGLHAIQTVYHTPCLFETMKAVLSLCLMGCVAVAVGDEVVVATQFVAMSDEEEQAFVVTPPQGHTLLTHATFETENCDCENPIFTVNVTSDDDFVLVRNFTTGSSMVGTNVSDSATFRVTLLNCTANLSLNVSWYSIDTTTPPAVATTGDFAYNPVFSSQDVVFDLPSDCVYVKNITFEMVQPCIIDGFQTVRVVGALSVINPTLYLSDTQQNQYVLFRDAGDSRSFAINRAVSSFDFTWQQVQVQIALSRGQCRPMYKISAVAYHVPDLVKFTPGPPTPAPPVPTTPTPTDSPSSGLGSVGIAGIVLGSIAGCVLLCTVCAQVTKKSSSSKYDELQPIAG